MHGFKTTNEPRKLPWWRRLNDFPNPTLDALLTLFGTMVIVAVIYLFSRYRAHRMYAAASHQTNVRFRGQSRHQIV